MEWILILTIFAGYANGGSAVASVPGFESRAACMTAANAWIAQSKKNARSRQTNGVTALCVKRQ